MYVTQPKLTLLTHLVIRYQKTRTGRDVLYQEIYYRVYRFARKYLGGCEDELSGFCSFFFPKVPAMVESFSYRGITFDYYIKRSVCFSIKTFISRKQQRRYEQAAVLCSFNEPQADQPGEFLTVHTPPCRYITKHRKSLEKRILILCAVKALSLPVSLYPVVAEESGYSLTYITWLFHELRSREQRRYERYQALARRRDQYYGDLMVVQIKLASELSEEDRQVLRQKEQRLKVLLDRVRKRLSSFPLNIPHRVVADMLEIPKGTVDSAIHYLKKHTLHS